jgi:hypothetical protein
MHRILLVAHCPARFGLFPEGMLLRSTLHPSLTDRSRSADIRLGPGLVRLEQRARLVRRLCSRYPGPNMRPTARWLDRRRLPAMLQQLDASSTGGGGFRIYFTRIFGAGSFWALEFWALVIFTFVFTICPDEVRASSFISAV